MVKQEINYFRFRFTFFFELLVLIHLQVSRISQYYPSIKLLDRTIDQLPWGKIISHNYNIDNINKAMEVAMSDKSMKVLVNP